METCALVVLYFFFFPIFHEKKFSEEEIRQKTALTAYCRFKFRVPIIYLWNFIEAQKMIEIKNWNESNGLRLHRLTQNLTIVVTAHRMPWISLHINAVERIKFRDSPAFGLFFFFYLVFLFIFIHQVKRSAIFFLSYVDCHYYCYYYHQTSETYRVIEATLNGWHYMWFEYADNICPFFSFALSYFFIFALQILMLWAVFIFFSSFFTMWYMVDVVWALTMIFSLFFIFAHYLWYCLIFIMSFDIAIVGATNS